MLSLVSIICMVIGYILFFITNMIAFPTILIIAGFIIALIDLIILYNKEKLQFSDFLTEAFHTSLGSTIAFLAGIIFILLLIF